MSNNPERTRQAYRDRLSEGDSVYFVETEDPFGYGNLVVKKATVLHTNFHDGGRMYSPVLLYWGVREDSGGMTTIKSPLKVFTEAEVRQAIQQQEDLRELDERPVDELVLDLIGNQELTTLLGGLIIERLLETGLDN